MKKKKIFKAMLSIIIILLSLFSIGYLAYSLTFYEGVETFYRIYAIVILIYFFLLLSYLELRSIKKEFATPRRTIVKDEITEIVKEVIASLGATSMKDMGPVMKEAKAKIGAAADGRAINEVVKDLLG